MEKKPIRAIIGRFALPFSRAAVERVISDHSIEFCADIFGGPSLPPFAGIPPSAQERFESSEIRNAYYAGTDWKKLAPLDEEVIENMRACEAVFMTLVTRLENKRTVPYTTRKLWYLRHLQFWNDYLTRNRINLYISAWIPHEIPDFIIYSLCKLRNIPVIYFDITVFKDIAVMGNDISAAAPAIEQKYQELLSAQTDGMTVTLSEPFDSYEKALTSPAGKPPALVSLAIPTPWDHLKWMLWKRPLRIIKSILILCTPSGLLDLYQRILQKIALAEAARFYNAHASRPDLSIPFVYFPLHFQPEAATVPMGGVFGDQILAAQLLYASLPEDVYLYIKEHPQPSNAANRSIQFYQDLLSLPRVRFMPRNTDTFLLREHCKAVMTITGSAGFEALFRQKPVFLFGSCYYQYAKGIFPIRTTDDCRKAMEAVFVRGEKPQRATTRLYLKAMEETCVRGVVDPWFLQISHKSEAEHTEAIGSAISRAIGAL